jgi:hypothetical protein
MIVIDHQPSRVSVSVFGEFTLADYKEFEEVVNFKVKFEGPVDLYFRPEPDGRSDHRRGLGGNQVFPRPRQRFQARCRGDRQPVGDVERLVVADLRQCRCRSLRQCRGGKILAGWNPEAMSFTTLVDVATLAAHLDDPDWLIVDVRHQLADTATAHVFMPRATFPVRFPALRLRSVGADHRQQWPPSLA